MSIRRLVSSTASIALLVGALSGCASTNGGTGVGGSYQRPDGTFNTCKAASVGITAVGVAALANYLAPNGPLKWLATLAGIAAGAYGGSILSDHLGCEEDKKAAVAIGQQAATGETGQPVYWSSGTPEADKAVAGDIQQHNVTVAALAEPAKPKAHVKPKAKPKDVAAKASTGAGTIAAAPVVTTTATTAAVPQDVKITATQATVSSQTGSGAWGYTVPLSDNYVQDGKTCRTMATYVKDSTGKVSQDKFMSCKGSDDRWAYVKSLSASNG